jgi:hypothetical protein
MSEFNLKGKKPKMLKKWNPASAYAKSTPSKGKGMATKGKGKGKGKKSSQAQKETAKTLLSMTNKILATIGITTKKINSLGELQRVASSMFVAIYEAFKNNRVKGIVRSRKGGQSLTQDDYIHNVQRVIQEMEVLVGTNLSHITGKSIVQGDLKSLYHLLTLFDMMVGQNPNANAGGPAPDISNSVDLDNDGSISTHESTFEESEPIGAIETFKVSSSKVRDLVEEDSRQLLLQTEGEMKQREKIEAANQRKKALQSFNNMKVHRRNEAKREITTRMRHQRWMEDTVRAGDAYEKRQNSQEQVMIRKIYSGLLKKLHEWRRSERSEAKEKLLIMRDEAKEHISGLQNLFKDRFTLLAEQNQASTDDENIRTKAQTIQADDLMKSFHDRQKVILNTHRSKLAQRRSQQLLQRKESHKNLLALLSVESWPETLRGNDFFNI